MKTYSSLTYSYLIHYNVLGRVSNPILHDDRSLLEVGNPVDGWGQISELQRIPLSVVCASLKVSARVCDGDGLKDAKYRFRIELKINRKENHVIFMVRTYRK